MSRLLYEQEENEFLLAKACKTEDEKARLNNAYSIMEREIDKYGLDNRYGLICVAESMISASQYYAISKLILFKEDTIVVDCGCSTGIQQVFFRDCYKYIGIDEHGEDTFFKICDNAEFIHGNIEEVLPNMVFDSKKKYMGISVLCGSVFPYVGKAIKDKFNEIIII